MATENYRYWDSFAEALEPLDDATYGRIMRAINHKVFGVFGYVDPDFSDNPLLEPAYTVIMRTAEQSMDIAKRARENGSKSAGRPRKTSSKKTSQKPRKKVGLTNRKEERGEEATASILPSPTLGAYAPVASAPAPAPDGPPPAPPYTGNDE